MWKYIFGRKGLFQPFDSKGMKYNCNSKPPRCIIFNGTVILEFRAKASFTIWYDDICQGLERWKIWGIPGNPWHNQREIHNLQSKVTSLYAVKIRGGRVLKTKRDLPKIRVEYPNVCLNTGSDVIRTPTKTSYVLQLWRRSFRKRLATHLCHHCTADFIKIVAISPSIFYKNLLCTICINSH